MNLTEALEKIGRGIVEDAKKTIKKLRKINTAKLYNTMWFKVEGEELTFIMEPYAKYVNDGVGPLAGHSKGKMAPPGTLLSWMKNKGISSGLKKSEIKSVEFLIRRHIQEIGIEPTHFFDDAYENYTEDIEKVLDGYMDDLLNI